jgi:hypothetical protein
MPSSASGGESGNTAAAPALKFPSAVQLSYALTQTRRGQATPGTALLTWRSDGQRYDMALEFNVEGLGRRIQTSVGSIFALGLAPERFTDRAARRGELAVHFRRELAAPSIEFSNNRPAAKLLPGAQDRLSLYVQLAALLAGQGTHLSTGSLAFQVAGLGAADLWEFNVLSPQAVDTPAGPVQAIKLLRPPRHTYDPRMELWLAPSLGYLPVRILIGAQEEGAEPALELVLRQ